MSTPTVISKQTIQSLLFDHGIDPAYVVLPDPRYALPAIDWIAGDFARSFVPWRDRELGLYEPGDTDCDDFTEAATFYARLCFRRTVDRPKGAGIAFGDFYYQQGGGGFGHAINVAVCRDLDNLRLVFFEPQTANLITLNRKEIESCSFVSM